jgi:chemotaxis protein CheX
LRNATVAAHAGIGHHLAKTKYPSPFAGDQASPGVFDVIVTATEKSSARVRPDATWPSLVVNAAREVFQMMAGLDVAHIVNPPGRPTGSVSALIGIAGAMSAVLRVRCSPETAAHVAMKMLGGVEPPAKAAAEDAVGEISNMVAGNFKSKIATLGDGCVLSVPTVVSGEDYEVRQVGKGERIEVCLDTGDRAIWLILEISG